MRALTRGERQASVGVVLGLVAVLALLVSTLLLTLSYRSQLIEVKTVLAGRCELRQESDRSTADDLQARIDLYQAMVEIEVANRFIDEAVRSKRVKAYTNAMTQAQARLTALPPPVNCQRVYADAPAPLLMIR